MRSALSSASASHADLRGLSMHGTATPLGDPIGNEACLLELHIILPITVTISVTVAIEWLNLESRHASC